METEIIEVPLTFDELLEDDYYKSEFEKHVQQRLEEIKSHSDVKGGIEMNDEVQKNEGEEKKQATETVLPTAEEAAPVDNPAAEQTNDETEKEGEQKQPEPAREMSAEQFDKYNETLRRVSKTAKASITGRYNAFEDAAVKALVKQQVMAGEDPNVKEIADEVIKRLTPKSESHSENEEAQTKAASAEITSLKAENALLKAGIKPERIDAAKALFLAEGGNLDKVAEFAAKYPEWHKEEGVFVFSKATPLAGKTAPSSAAQPTLNDFEKKVAEARKRAGLD